MDPVQGEVTRSYILHLPASYDPANTAATPLLLDYHGYTASANLQLLLFPWRQVADRDETGGDECHAEHNICFAANFFLGPASSCLGFAQPVYFILRGMATLDSLRSFL